ncbi:Averufin oxidase A [Aspergillus multicolor]|uniref:Averufin oxidase A n=1 Tax=Aspergillus multicolor TaxID=41759 RepID=UPI003CCD5CF3
MPTYALLGATGATGSSILRHLLHSEFPENLTINILVRHKSKLLSAFPDLALDNPRSPRPTPSRTICIHEGTSTNPNILQPVIANASVVFNCVAQNGSPMGTTLVQDTAAALLAATRRQPQPPGRRSPLTVIQLRSASLNPVLAAQVPRFVHRIVSFCLAAGYDDLRRACALYERAAREELLRYVFVDPPTLHDALGTRATGYRLITVEEQAVCLSYADLGVAMCEIADRVDELQGRAIGVTATGPVNQSWGVLAGYLLQGGLGQVSYRYGRGNVLVGGVSTAFLLACLYTLV